MNVGISKSTKYQDVKKHNAYHLLFGIFCHFCCIFKVVSFLTRPPNDRRNVWQKLQIAPQVEMMDKKEKKTRP